MTMDLSRIVAEMDRFRAEILESPNEALDVILERYIVFRRSLSKHFRNALERRLLGTNPVIETVVSEIERRIMSAAPHGIPDKYYRVRPYSQTHSVLLQYLAENVGVPVAASRLRVLTGDQTHTERRVRELRDLGLDITWKKVSDEDQYFLKSLEIDAPTSIRSQLDRSIRADKTLSDRQRSALLAAVSAQFE